MGSLNKIMANTGEMFMGKKSFFQPLQEKTIESFMENGTKAGWKDVWNGTKKYYSGADYAGEGMKRAGAVGLRTGVRAGAWMGGAMAIRAIDGGSFTTNSNGERDIAGIPFI